MSSAFNAVSSMTVAPTYNQTQIVVIGSVSPRHLLQNLEQNRLRVVEGHKASLQVYVVEDEPMKVIHVSGPRETMLGRKEGPGGK